MFTDHSSDFTYIDLINGTTTDTIISVKREYARVAKVHDILKVKQHHADNLRSNDQEFQDVFDNTD